MTPVILDTDIGTDIDDTWALAMLLRCPELDLRLVTTATGDTRYRAQIVAGMLAAGGRDDVPIGIGVPTTLFEGVPERPQGRFADRASLEAYAGGVHEDGVGALIDCILGCDEPVTLITIGPMTNIGAALERAPRITERARLVGMLGSVYGMGDVLGDRPNRSKGPVPEYNVICDVPACRAAFRAPWETTITPLDTCGEIVLRGDRYRRVVERDSLLLRAVLDNYEEWHDSWLAAGPPWSDGLEQLDSHFADGGADVPFWRRSSTVLFDTVAVYLGYDESLLNIERLPIELGDDGVTRVADDAPELRVATTWRDRQAFEDHLVERLLR
jgi:inosine-uridine nucleoside N-ribohydrolase